MNRYKFHRFKFLLLSKRFTTDVRNNTLQLGEIGIGHDFTEALSITHADEIQTMHFGHSVNISIEGYTLHYRLNNQQDRLTFDFHSFLSDDKTQLSSTVHWHMEKLICILLETKILLRGGRILGITDGCAKQYKSATAVYFLSTLAVKYNIVVDRAISASGHGKSSVDAINGLDKNTITRTSARIVQNAEDALKKESKSLKVQSFEDVGIASKRYSPAEDCKRILEQEAVSSVKSTVKHEKREDNRKINTRSWHVRPIDETLNGMKCSTIKIADPSVTFSDMYHYYTCWELGIGCAALRRFPCNCQACDEQIRISWVDGIDSKIQPRFKLANNCRFGSILGDSNKWHLVQIEESDKATDVDATLFDILHHVTTAVASTINIGSVGAVCTSDGDAVFGYYLFEFMSLPYTDQNHDGYEDDDIIDGCISLKCEGRWMYELPGTKDWYYTPPLSEQHGVDSIDVVNVVLSEVVMEELSATNKPTRRNANAQAGERNAKRMSKESHDFIVDEIVRREALEYDPSRVFGEELE